MSDKIHKFELANAKLEELEKFKSNHVLEVANNEDPYRISLKWVNTTKFVNGKLTVSPTCTKEDLRVVTNVIDTNQCNPMVM